MKFRGDPLSFNHQKKKKKEGKEVTKSAWRASKEPPNRNESGMAIAISQALLTFEITSCPMFLHRDQAGC